VGAFGDLNKHTRYRIERLDRHVKRFNHILLATFIGRWLDLQSLTQKHQEVRLASLLLSLQLSGAYLHSQEEQMTPRSAPVKHCCPHCGHHILNIETAKELTRLSQLVGVTVCKPLQISATIREVTKLSPATVGLSA
jgi:predicted RNA-binding Zn-ribbon protein involved in translation (DUF1610 family)